MHTFWVTFYSYKGGVGRSMALANVAATLAKLGRRVLMIDFDLEAPGLDSFEEFDLPSGHPGLVEYVCHYLETGRPAKVGDFVHEIRPLDFSDPDHPSPQLIDGNLWLMTSGAKDDGYNRKRLSIDWADLYRSRSGAEFFENLKAELEDTFHPDYVFVDSRTGLTDVGGVCTLHLPDLVVLLFALNEQNVQGIASVANVLRTSERPPQILPVASPVPLAGQNENLIQERIWHAQNLLQTKVELTIHYSPRLALRERIASLSDSNSYSGIEIEYEEIADEIRNSTPDGIDFYITELEASIEEFHVDRSTRLAEAMAEKYPDRVETWLKQSEVARIRGDYEGFEMHLRKALEISPGNRVAVSSLIRLLSNAKRNDDLSSFYTDVLDRPGNLDPDFAVQTHYDAGRHFMMMGNFAEALKHFETARENDRSQYGYVGYGDDVFDVGDFDRDFMIAEARRRSTGTIVRADWKPLADRFLSGALTRYSVNPTVRCFGNQLSYLAFACSGNIQDARKILVETEQLIPSISKFEELFSVTDFRHHSPNELATHLRNMLEALDRGELWDGMKVG
jgi:MinD-like ATPase involved in chromosome partitioning or flagellar assembly